MSAFFSGILLKLGEWLLSKAAAFIVVMYKQYKRNKAIDDKVEEELKEHEKSVKEIKEIKKNKGKVSEEQIKKHREKTRRLVRDIFS
jgi:uncharacterized membrane protein